MDPPEIKVSQSKMLNNREKSHVSKEMKKKIQNYLSANNEKPERKKSKEERSVSESGEIKINSKAPKSKNKRKSKKKKKKKKSDRESDSKSREPRRTKRIKKKKKKKKKQKQEKKEEKQVKIEETKIVEESESEVDYGDIDEENLLKTREMDEHFGVRQRKVFASGNPGLVSGGPTEEVRPEIVIANDIGGKIREEKTSSPPKAILTSSPAVPQLTSDIIEEKPQVAASDDHESSGSDMFASKSASEEKKPRGKSSQLPDSGLANDEELYYKPNIGETLHGKYRVVSILGKGVYSLVLKVEHQGLTFALKILRKAEVIRQAGEREIEILDLLNQGDSARKSFIIEIHDSFDHKGFLCIVLEMMGLNLRDMLNNKRKGKNFSLEEVRLHSFQLLTALSQLETKGILHLDIKPDNILYDEANRVCKLTDFGTSLEVGEVEQGKEYVSRYYRAPEVFLGGQLGHGVDIWSMACTFFEMFCGEFLFAGKNDPHMLDLFLVTRGKLSLKYLKKCLVRSPNHIES